MVQDMVQSFGIGYGLQMGWRKMEAECLEEGEMELLGDLLRDYGWRKRTVAKRTTE